MSTAAIGTERPWKAGQSESALPRYIRCQLLGNGECVIHLDPEVV
jgi:hypothetical protein